MTKITNTCPVSIITSGARYLEKATKAMFTALSIISIHIKITTALRLAKAPYMPIQNRIDDRTR
jgi:hypothetical protein